MVSTLVFGSGRLAGDIVLCSWARHFTLTVPLSTQVYKWVLANLISARGLTLRWLASCPGGSRNTSSRFMRAPGSLYTESGSLSSG